MTSYPNRPASLAAEERIAQVRAGCCAQYRKPCGYHDGYTDALEWITTAEAPTPDPCCDAPPINLPRRTEREAMLAELAYFAEETTGLAARLVLAHRPIALLTDAALTELLRRARDTEATP